MASGAQKKALHMDGDVMNDLSIGFSAQTSDNQSKIILLKCNFPVFLLLPFQLQNTFLEKPLHCKAFVDCIW